MEHINNEVVNFIFAAKRFGDRNKPGDPDFPGVPEIAEWCTEVEKQLSPFLLNDISLLIEKTVLITVYLFLMTRKDPAIQTVEDFLSKLSKITPEDFKSYVSNELFEEQPDKITEKMIYDMLIDEGLHPGYDPKEESKLLFGFLKDPDNFLKRLNRTYMDFYEEAYKNSLDKFRELEQQKLEWHRRRLAEDGNEYFRQLGLLSFMKENFAAGDPVIYFSFFADNETSTFWKVRTIVIGGGIDQRILHRSARNKADIFFSCFGDPKRLEILRLTAQRPWYSTELANHFNLKPATLSYHMNKLVDAELLHISKGESRRFYYTLNKKVVEEYLGYVSQDLLGLDYDGTDQ